MNEHLDPAAAEAAPAPARRKAARCALRVIRRDQSKAFYRATRRSARRAQKVSFIDAWRLFNDGQFEAQPQNAKRLVLKQRSRRVRTATAVHPAEPGPNDLVQLAAAAAKRARRGVCSNAAA